MMDRLATFQFGQPWWLLLLGLIPLLAWLQGRRGRVAAVRFSSVGILRKIGALPESSAGRWKHRLALIALGLLVLALARPRMEKGDSDDKKEGIDIVLCIDLSGSMEAEDFIYEGKKIPRAKALNLALNEFVTKRPNDRFGIIGFATDTYLVSPLTMDGDWIKNILGVVKSNLPGTAIGEGIVSSVELLKEAKGTSKVIVVATDGENNAGRLPKDGAEVARQHGVRVHTLRIAPLRTVTADSAVKSALGEVAEKTGGLYFQAADLNSMFDVYRQIDKMEKSRFEQKKYRVYDELFFWFAIPAGLVALGAWMGGQTIWSRLP
jgi:Ca-activated chloride channel family protein